MEINYDPEADAMNIKFQEGRYKISKEVVEGVNIDYIEDGKIISIEILYPKECP